MNGPGVAVGFARRKIPTERSNLPQEDFDLESARKGTFSEANLTLMRHRRCFRTGNSDFSGFGPFKLNSIPKQSPIREFATSRHPIPLLFSIHTRAPNFSPIATPGVKT